MGFFTWLKQFNCVHAWRDYLNYECRRQADGHFRRVHIKVGDPHDLTPKDVACIRCRKVILADVDDKDPSTLPNKLIERERRRVRGSYETNGGNLSLHSGREEGTE